MRCGAVRWSSEILYSRAISCEVNERFRTVNPRTCFADATFRCFFEEFTVNLPLLLEIRFRFPVSKHRM